MNNIKVNLDVDYYLTKRVLRGDTYKSIQSDTGIGAYTIRSNVKRLIHTLLGKDTEYLVLGVDFGLCPLRVLRLYADKLLPLLREECKKYNVDVNMEWSEDSLNIANSKWFSNFNKFECIQ